MSTQTTDADGVTEVPAGTSRSLVSLLGDQRAAIVEYLRRAGDASVSELATHLGVSEVATRRHLAVLEGESLVMARTVPQGRGRPPARYTLTETAGRLFPQGYDRLAADMMEFLGDEYGRGGLRSFLRWRLEREVDHLRDAVTAEQLHDRLEQLAGALSDAGFAASVTPDADGFTLTQDHCAIYDVAKDHPEVCAYEAATFSKVLGRDVILSRRETLAGGSSACVCSVAPRPNASPGSNPQTSPPTNAHQTSPQTSPQGDPQ
jgi:predicted ArsR family transcriptional regulator